MSVNLIDKERTRVLVTRIIFRPKEAACILYSGGVISLKKISLRHREHLVIPFLATHTETVLFVREMYTVFCFVPKDVVFGLILVNIFLHLYNPSDHSPLPPAYTH